MFTYNFGMFWYCLIPKYMSIFVTLKQTNTCKISLIEVITICPDQTKTIRRINYN